VPLDPESPRLTQSDFEVFDFPYAERLKKEYPKIWKAGGNVRGNQAFQYLTKYKNGDRGEGTLAWVKEREAWCARHFNDGKQFKENKSPNLSSIGGIIAQVKWGCVGVLGQSKMKDVIQEVKDKLDSSANSMVKAKAEGVEVVLSGEVGSWAVSADQIAKAIQGKPEQPLTIKINSVGGDVFEGFALYNAIRYHKGHTTAIVEGLAASAASLFAMGADVVTMRRASMMMIHNPWMMTAGDSKDLRSAADTLDKIKSIMVERYQDKTGQDEESLRQLLDEETWLTPEEAVELGFADKIDDEDASIETVQNSIINQFKAMFKSKSQVLSSLTVDEIKSLAGTLPVAEQFALIQALADNLEGVSEVCVKMEDSEKYMSSPEVAIIPMEDHALIIAMGALEERAVEAMEEEEEKAMEEEEVESMEEEEVEAMEEEEEKAEDEEYKSLSEAVQILSSQVNELLEEKASQVVASAKKESKPISWKQAVIASAKNQKTK